MTSERLAGFRLTPEVRRACIPAARVVEEAGAGGPALKW